MLKCSDRPRKNGGPVSGAYVIHYHPNCARDGLRGLAQRLIQQRRLARAENVVLRREQAERQLPQFLPGDGLSAGKRRALPDQMFIFLGVQDAGAVVAAQGFVHIRDRNIERRFFESLLNVERVQIYAPPGIGPRPKRIFLGSTSLSTTTPKNGNIISSHV